MTYLLPSPLNMQQDLGTLRWLSSMQEHGHNFDRRYDLAHKPRPVKCVDSSWNSSPTACCYCPYFPLKVGLQIASHTDSVYSRQVKDCLTAFIGPVAHTAPRANTASCTMLQRGYVTITGIFLPFFYVFQCSDGNGILTVIYFTTA